MYGKWGWYIAIILHQQTGIPGFQFYDEFLCLKRFFGLDEKAGFTIYICVSTTTINSIKIAY